MIQEHSNTKRQLSITILIVLFLGSLCYTVYEEHELFEVKKEVAEFKERTPRYFDYGTITKNTYCNDFFKFQIQISKGHEVNYKIYDHIDKNIYEKDPVLAEPKLASTIKDHNLLIIEPELVKIDLLKNFKETGNLDAWQNYSSEKYKRESFGSEYQMAISAHNLSGKSLKNYINLFKNLHNPDYGSTKTKLISNIKFHEYQGAESRENPMQQVIFENMGGKNKNITS